MRAGKGWRGAFLNRGCLRVMLLPTEPQQAPNGPGAKGFAHRGSRLRWELGGLGWRLGPRGIKQSQDPLSLGS